MSNKKDYVKLPTTTVPELLMRKYAIEYYSRYAEQVSSVKESLVKYKGGKCEMCGYSRSIAALDFHHRDPKTKSFNISPGMTRSIERLMEESDKCALLCSNCHRELHAIERQK